MLGRQKTQAKGESSNANPQARSLDNRAHWVEMFHFRIVYEYSPAGPAMRVSTFPLHELRARPRNSTLFQQCCASPGVDCFTLSRSVINIYHSNADIISLPKSSAMNRDESRKAIRAERKLGLDPAAG